MRDCKNFELILKIFYAMLFLDARPSETLEINFFRSLLIKILISTFMQEILKISILKNNNSHNAAIENH